MAFNKGKLGNIVLKKMNIYRSAALLCDTSQIIKKIVHQYIELLVTLEQWEMEFIQLMMTMKDVDLVKDVYKL